MNEVRRNIKNLDKPKTEQLKRWNDSSISKESVEYKEKTVRFDPVVSFLNACINFEINDIEKMLRNGIDINCCDVDHLTALHNACINNNLELTKYLLDKGANINACDKESWTPMHVACEMNLVEMAQLLIKSGARLDICSVEGDLPIHLVKGNSRLQDIVQKEMDKLKINVDECVNYERNMMLNDIRKWAQTNQYTPPEDKVFRSTPLHVAAAKNYIDVINRLLPLLNEKQINAKDIDGWTPLHAAAHWAHHDVCVILLKAGADPDILTNLQESIYDLVEEQLRESFRQQMKLVMIEIKGQKQTNVVLRHLAPLEVNSQRRRSSIIRQSVEMRKNVQMKDPASERRALSQIKLNSEKCDPTSPVDDEVDNKPQFNKKDRKHSMNLTNLMSDYASIQESDEQPDNLILPQSSDLLSPQLDNMPASADEVSNIPLCEDDNQQPVNSIDLKDSRPQHNIKTSLQILEDNKVEFDTPRINLTDSDSSADKSLNGKNTPEIKFRSKTIASSMSSASSSSSSYKEQPAAAVLPKKASQPSRKLSDEVLPSTIKELRTSVPIEVDESTSPDTTDSLSTQYYIKRSNTVTLESDRRPRTIEKRLSLNQARSNVLSFLNDKINLQNTYLMNPIDNCQANSIDLVGDNADDNNNIGIHDDNKLLSTGEQNFCEPPIIPSHKTTSTNASSVASVSDKTSNNLIPNQRHNNAQPSFHKVSSTAATSSNISTPTNTQSTTSSVSTNSSPVSIQNNHAVPSFTMGSYKARPIIYNVKQQNTQEQSNISSTDEIDASLRSNQSIKPCIDSSYLTSTSSTNGNVFQQNNSTGVAPPGSTDTLDLSRVVTAPLVLTTNAAGSTSCPSTFANRLLGNESDRREMLQQIKQLQEENRLLKEDSQLKSLCSKCHNQLTNNITDYDVRKELLKYKEENRILNTQKDALLRVINKIQGDLESFHKFSNQ